MPPSLMDYQKNLTDEIAGAIAPQVAALPRAGAVGPLIDSVGWEIDRMMAQAAPKPPSQELLACRAGCAFCCHQFEVHLSPLEALHVADYVRHTFDEARRDALLARIDKHEAQRRGVNPRDAAFHRLPCPLLEDGRCSVYAVRPFICRSVTSYDVGQCQTRAEKAGSTVDVPVHGGIRAMGQAAHAALLRASTQVQGGSVILDLARAVKAALGLADATRRWLGGEKIFEGAGATVEPRAPKKG
jgi:Fe-S-cluster containining protein